MDFEACLDRYAEILVGYAMNVQKGQEVRVQAEVCHRTFVDRVVRAAYRRGARFVDVSLVDPRLDRTRILESALEDLSFVPGYVEVQAREWVDRIAATLRLSGSEDPDVLDGLDPDRLNAVRKARYQALRVFYEIGVHRSSVHWTVAGAATPAWGRKVFPDLEPEAACRRLWEEIFRLTRADRPDAVDVWLEHDRTLKRRARALDALQIETLRFRGPGTDLAVGLSPVARFQGGRDKSLRGVEFEPNVPTEEVFTTPDWRRTEGTARATRPIYVNGNRVEGLVLEFEGGRLARFQAARGAEVFGAYIDSDEGGRRLGEVALVGVDSPVFQSGLVFQDILYDENAACHIAVGSAYKSCLEGHAGLDADAFDRLGCNESTVHTDVMISSEEVDVDAETRSGSTVPILRQGGWVLAT